MEFIIHNTYSLYKEMLTLPNEERMNFYENKLMEPFHELFRTMHMPMNTDKMGFMPITGNDADMNEMLDKLKNFAAWKIAHASIESAAVRFKNAGIPMPEKVVLGIFLDNPAFLSNSEGYTGFGGVPGYIQIVIAPNEYNLPRLKTAIAHEFHHNVLFNNAKWNFMNDISVAKYIAVEGLAESFAASLYGEEYIGPWVTSVQGEDLAKSCEIIGKALDVNGFNKVRKYIFGDQLIKTNGAESTGITPFAGYAIGYHAVQSFLKNTGISIEEATLMDGETIMKMSGNFK